MKWGCIFRGVGATTCMIFFLVFVEACYIQESSDSVPSIGVESIDLSGEPLSKQERLIQVIRIFSKHSNRNWIDAKLS